MSPWGAAMDHTVMMAPPPSFPYPMPMAMPPGSIPMHPSMPSYPYFGNQNPSMMPAPCTTYMPYMPPNTIVEQQSVHIPQNPSNRSREPRTKASRESRSEKAEDSNDVATQLELKTPGSTSDKDTSSQRPEKTKRSKRNSSNNNNSIEESSHSSKCSSSPSVRDSSSSSSVAGGQKPDDAK
nr:unnamed protein product [Eutrema halophilum]